MKAADVLQTFPITEKRLHAVRGMLVDLQRVAGLKIKAAESADWI